MSESVFIRKAPLAGPFLFIMTPMIGVMMANRKASMTRDALSHMVLTGVGMGLISGFDPLVRSAIVCVIAAFLIEVIRKKSPQYGDMAMAVIMSTGLGIAAILSDFAPGGNSFESYLFGSISSVTSMDVVNISPIFVTVLCVSVMAYSGLLVISIDPNLARMSGVKVKVMNAVFTFSSVITTASAVKTVGVLMVTSLVVLPVATSLTVVRSYKSAYLLTIGLGATHMTVGIILPFYLDIRPDEAIVVNAILGMLVFVLYRKVRKA